VAVSDVTELLDFDCRHQPGEPRSGLPVIETSLAGTARRLYDAEVALHIARQSHVDAWIRAAADRLHEAVLAHSVAVLAQPLAVDHDKTRLSARRCG